ncbi:MAG: DUF998 domain-containing protein [Halodesulfurarchaeum sp.]
MNRQSGDPLRNRAESQGKSPRRRAGLLLVAVAGTFLAVLVLATAMVPDYSYRTAAISDLGVHPETALFFNASLLVVGVLNLLAGVSFHRIHGNRWLLLTYAIASVGAAGVGLVPLGSGPLHGFFALIAFLFFNLEAIGSGRKTGGTIRKLSVLAGAIGLGFLVAFVLGGSGVTAVFGPFGYGGTERMIVYPVLTWALVFGGFLLGTEAGETGDAAGRAK